MPLLDAHVPKYEVRERHSVALPVTPDGSLLTTETRVHALSPRARWLFRLYWLVVGPFSALSRRRWLKAIAQRT